MADEQSLGLTTQEALGRLHQDMESVLQEKDWTGGRRTWIRESLSPCCPHTTLSWPSVAALFIAGVSLLAAAGIGDERAPNVLDGLIILLLLFLSIATALWDGKLRREEIVNRAGSLVASIRKMKDVRWTEDNYPNLASPASPCITLQWAWRDGHVVNLPWALLVRGDVILLRPGQVVPGLCVPVEEKNGQTLHAREIYNPQVPRENLTLPAARAPMENKQYVLLETPYTRSLRMTLGEALKRPVSFHDKERFLIVTQCIEQTALPLVVITVLVVNTARQLYLDEWFGRGPWWDSLLVQSISAGLPLLPLTLPVVWRLIGAWGVTKLRAVLQDTTPAQINHDPFEDADLETSSLQCGELWRFYKDDLLGRSPLLCRSANVVHVLGSVTALCCVDKKGVLSWPNPTAEKVFFLRQPDEHDDNDSEISEGYDSTRRGSGPEEPQERDPLRTVENTDDAVAEVLDLTHDHTSPFGLHFDDQKWKQHLTSLKPLGLAILLNTCNAESQEVYSQFCCNLTCEAAQNESLVPVTNRRCLCELAAQIGFMEQAQGSFNLEQILCTFQHVRPETVKRDIKFARQLSKATKFKFPFPHMVATVLRDKQTGCLQLMSQGTADVILDSCVEYWDGFDLHPLTPCDRKKILDFYQRTSLTANCTAFAYRPLSKTVSPRLAQVYLEVPPDSRHLYLPYRSPTPLALSLFDAKWRGVLAQFHSSDSLLGMDGKEEEVVDMEGWFELQCNQVFVGMVTMQYQAQADVVHLVEQLERACIRFVHFSKENELRSRVFSEKMGLESGWNCHISLLSDRNRSDGVPSCVESRADIPPSPIGTPTATPQILPAPTVSAALQLDVQLLNERTNLTSSRAMSFSAPCAINTDLLTVKFDEQVLNWPDDTAPATTAFSHRERRISQDSVVAHSVDGDQWRSLSCLTDSTDQSVPFAFDISNRAKLPRGIDKIRPHLELIDNVPLLVSLFTDCTPTVTREMLHIMQDYGEVVCVFGSSANCDNVGVFLQADASIAVEPLYPQVCQKLPVFFAPTPHSGPSPVELSRALSSLPCAVSMRREDPLSLFQLITCARDFCLALRNCLQFWLCCVCSLSAFLVLSAILMLPPPLNSGQVLFICCLLVPILSASLMALPTDPQVMHKATGKNQCIINSEAIGFVIWCYGLKCLPNVLVLALVHVSGLAFYCHEIARVTNGTCSLIYPSAVLNADSTWGGWTQYGYTVLNLQHCSAILFVLHLVAASASYVHRDKPLWRALPTHHIAWVSAGLATPLLQILYTAVILYSTPLRDSRPELEGVTHPWPLVIGALATPILILATNEAVKWHEMKVNKRFQRRKRLDFGTKLGMNSPF